MTAHATRRRRPEAASTISRRDLLRTLPLVTGGLLLGAGCRRPAPAVDSSAAAALPEPLWRGSARELAAGIARGEVSSAEVIEAFLTRIEEVNGDLNAVTRVLADEARSGAAAADAARAAGEALGPLHGVPFTIKENIDVVGSPTTQGVPSLADNLPQRDATIVARLRAAGAVPLGRTNLPDFGLRVHTSSHLHGLTRNPWNPELNVGGSSGGEGAALATGMTPLGLGNDIGGSLRIPAQCNGIASLKPTFGRLPGTGGAIGGQLMSVDGPMARRVADLELGLHLMAGYDPHDPWSMPVPLELERPSAPLRVALVPEPSGGATHPSVAEGVRKAGRALADAGYAVEEIEPPRLGDVTRTWSLLIGAEINLQMAQLEEWMSAEATRFLRWSLEIFDLEASPGSGTAPSSNVASRSLRGLEQYAEVLATRHVLASEWQLFQTEHPLIVGPVLTQPPFPVGYDVESLDAVRDVLEQMRFEVALNLLGLPAVSVPVGVADGLPQVVEVIGGRYREDLCLQAAEVLEQSYGTLTPIDPQPPQPA